MMRLCVVAIGVLTATAVLADDHAERVVADWKSRQTAIKQIRYTATGTVERLGKLESTSVTIPKEDGLGSPVKGKPTADTSAARPTSLMCVLDLEAKRVRIEKSYSGFDPNLVIVKRRSVNCYNGKQLQTAVPRQENGIGEDDADMYLAKGNLSNTTIDADLWPVLEAHGIVPTVNRQSRFDRLPLDIKPDDLFYRSDTTLLGRKCRVFHTEPLNSIPHLSDEFWVDYERGSAIVRHVYLQQRIPFFKLDTVFHFQHGHWLPQSWTFSSYRGGDLFEIWKYKIESLRNRSVFVS